MKATGNISIEEWEKLVDSVDQASFFQGPTWAKILTRAYPQFKIASLLFQPDTLTRILLPLIEGTGKGGMVRAAYSMPFGTYGGLFANTDDLTPFVRDIFAYLRSLYNEVYIYPTPYSKVPYSLAPFKKTATYTHILNLEPGFDFIWEKVFNYKCRNHCRRADKSGVSVIIDDSEKAFQTYYQIYLQTVERWSKATTVYPWELFKAMASAKSREIKLWLARIDQEIVAGALCFYGKRDLVYWSSAMLKEFSKECPNYALQNEIIKDACQNGYITYNMGGSGDLEGVRTFKENFGAKKFEYSIYSFQSPLSKLLSSALGLLRR